ncbi:MAG: methyltransferase domain-containing protein [Desulfobacter sp.]|nr:MAG: methyltransferase domain-containing protein [Desulfobacter sp.]
MGIKINIGCGQTPTKGWQNYDNSWSVRLVKKPLLVYILRKMGFISEPQQKFISFAKSEKILWANAAQRIPEANDSVDVVYSSHMIEHMEKEDVISFLKESRRILKRGGTIRIAVPNIKYHVEKYVNHGDADKFIEGTYLTRKSPKTIIEKIKYLIIGDRNHQWMYDGESLCRLLASGGFKEPQIMDVGSTNIAEPGELNLKERSPESVFVEAINSYSKS